MQFSGNIVQKGGDVIQLKKKKEQNKPFDQRTSEIAIQMRSQYEDFWRGRVHCFGLNFSCVW